MPKHYAPIWPVNWLLKINFKTHDYISICNEPIVIFHGTSDGTIPISNAKRLEQSLKKGDRFVTITDGTHNNLPTFKLYRNVLDSVLNK